MKRILSITLLILISLKPILYVSHALEEVVQLADQLLVLERLNTSAAEMQMKLLVAEHDLCRQHSPPGDPSSGSTRRNLSVSYEHFQAST